MVVNYVAEQAYAQTVVSMHTSVQADSVYMCGTPIVHVHKTRIRVVPPKRRLSIQYLMLDALRLFDGLGGAWFVNLITLSLLDSYDDVDGSFTIATLRNLKAASGVHT